MRGISKRYPGVTALDRVDFDVAAGEVVGLIGENGAGKSTLLKVLAGATPPDEGTLEWQGRPLRLREPREAQHAGIAVIYQELSLAPNLTVQENLYLGREPRSYGPFIAGVREREMARAALAQVGLDVAPDTPTAQLSVAQRQLVEIAKALALDARLVVMDEPTSALAPREARRLFELIGRLAQRGIGVVYVSHRLEEVLSVCERVVALRDGRRVGETVAADATQDDLIRLMIGGDLASLFPKELVEMGEAVLAVRELAVPRLAAPVSFEVRAGEIVGWFGLVGSGRTETVEAVFGARRARGGTVTVRCGAPGPYADPRGAIRAGLGLVPEDRKERGLILGMAVEANVTLPGLARHARLGWRDRAWEREAAERGVRELAIRTPSIEQTVRNLSGGNQQKVVLAKWLELAPRVLLLDEPTRGIDVGAKAEIFALMGRMARRGMGLVFVSSEIEEIVGMADRVLVFHHGRIAGEVLREALDAERLLRLASGLEAA